MRSSQAKMAVWTFGESQGQNTDQPKEAPEEAFDSFGPLSDIRRALAKPTAPRPTFQAPHDFTRILLAEHDSFDRRLLRVLLTSPRISLIEVEDGQSAVDLLSLLEFDLLMINLDLPQMTGEDTIRWIRRSRTSWADIPILGLADQKHQSDVERLVSLGLTDWTPKPVVRQHLIEKIISLDAGPLRRAALAPADTVASG